MGKFLSWGTGAFQIVMKNKLVAIICFMFPGVMHTIDPVGSLDWDTMMLSFLLMLYAAVSIVFVLSNKNEIIGKGREAAGNLVKDYFEGQRDNSAKEQELLSNSKLIGERIKDSNTRFDERAKKLYEKHKNRPEPGKIVLFVTYSLLLAFAIAIFIWRKDFVDFVQIIFGGLLIVDGISGITTFAAAVKSKLKMKGMVLSLIISIFTILLGVVFIVMPRDTAPIVYRITGMMIIAKAVVDFVVMIRNREVISSVKDTLSQIKKQEPNADANAEANADVK